MPSTASGSWSFNPLRYRAASVRPSVWLSVMVVLLLIAGNRGPAVVRASAMVAGGPGLPGSWPGVWCSGGDDDLLLWCWLAGLGFRLPPDCVSRHHATDAIDAARGMGGGAVLPGRGESGAGIRGRHHGGRRWLRTGRPVPGAGASGWWQAADFEQLEAERLDLREHAIQRGAVGQRPGQHGVAAAGLRLQGGERGADRLAQAAADTDPVPVRRLISVGTGHGLTTHPVDRPAAVPRLSGPAQVPPPG